MINIEPHVPGRQRDRVHNACKQRLRNWLLHMSRCIKSNASKQRLRNWLLHLSKQHADEGRVKSLRSKVGTKCGPDSKLETRECIPSSPSGYHTGSTTDSRHKTDAAPDGQVPKRRAWAASIGAKGKRHLNVLRQEAQADSTEFVQRCCCNLFAPHADRHRAAVPTVAAAIAARSTP